MWQWQVQQGSPGVAITPTPARHAIPPGWRIRSVRSPYVTIEGGGDTLTLPANAQVEVSDAVDYPILDTSGAVLKAVVPRTIKVDRPGRPAAPKTQAPPKPNAEPVKAPAMQNQPQPKDQSKADQPKAAPAKAADPPPPPSEASQGPAPPKAVETKAEPYLHGFYKASEADPYQVKVDPEGHPWRVRSGLIWDRPKEWETVTVPKELAAQFQMNPGAFATGVQNFGLDVSETRKDIAEAKAQGFETVTANAPILGKLAAEAQGESEAKVQTLKAPDAKPLAAMVSEGYGTLTLLGMIALVAVLVAKLGRRPAVVVPPPPHAMAVRA